MTGARNRNALASALLRFVWLTFALTGLTQARGSCQCGFSVTSRDNETDSWLFTEMIETDFGTVQDMTIMTDWVRQEYNVSAEEGRGEYGKAFVTSNVEPMINEGVLGDEASGRGEKRVLGLRVNSSLSDDAVPAAEIDSSRLDLHWGSYRTGMKMTGSNGTCSAFFWYFNDTQEIDMEFLSQEFDPVNKIYPISLVIQSKESKEAGYDAAKTGTYLRVNLTFDPTADFHEYRFDYVPGRVVFYADSTQLAVMSGNEVPSVGGHLILQHWSNGNPLWSGGPPESDAVLEVSYVKAYFNTSDPLRLSNQVQECRSHPPEDREVCVVPDATGTDAWAGGHFFSKAAGGDAGEEASNGSEHGSKHDSWMPGNDTDGGGSDQENGTSGRPRRVVWMVMVVLVSMWLLQI